MDKKKVIVHINNVSKILGTKRQTLSAGALEHLQNELKLALIELSKPDWISVEKEHVPELRYDGSWDGILVCNKDKWIVPLSYAYHNDLEFTHWRRIDKLEV